MRRMPTSSRGTSSVASSPTGQEGTWSTTPLRIHSRAVRHIDDRFFDKSGQLKPPSQIDETDWSLYDSQLTASMAGHSQISAMMAKFGTTFSHIGGYKG